jgi:S-adenosylmethionine/arginine decarboxylase-like enzyme
MIKKPSRRFHLVLDAVDVEDKYLTDKKFLEEFLKEATRLVDMSILYGPIVVDGVPENPGLSAFCIIDYSHISIHTFTETKEFYLDIFSCASFDFFKLENFMLEKFKIKPEQVFKTIPKYQ